MRRRISEISDNVIHVDFDNPTIGDSEGDPSKPKRVVMELGSTAYEAISEEESLTGMNKSTITNRALQVYTLIMNQQREGKHVVFLDESMKHGNVIFIDDPRQ